MNCCIRAYYVYKEVWEATAEESSLCERKPENVSDRYVVSVKKEVTIMGHLPRKVSWGVFAVLVTERYYRMYSNRAQEIFS